MSLFQNRDDQQEYERSQKARELTPPPVEPFTPANLSAVGEKIKSEDKFAEGAPVSYLHTSLITYTAEVVP